MTGTKTPLFHPNFPPRLPASLVAGAGCKKLGVPSLRRPLFPQAPTPVLWAGTLQRYGRCRTDGHIPTGDRGQRGWAHPQALYWHLPRLAPGAAAPPAGARLSGRHCGCFAVQRPQNPPPSSCPWSPLGIAPPCVPLAPKGIEIKPAPKPQDGGGVAAVTVPPPQRVLSKAPGCKSEGTSAPLAPLGALLGGRRVDERN